MGKLIVIEGVDGTGKTTQAKLLADRLSNEYGRVVLTREPGGCTTAEEIRDFIFKARDTELSPITDLLLMLAARAEHIKHTIIPALTDDRIVVCDRFSLSSHVYNYNSIKRLFGNETDVISSVGYDIPEYLTILLDAPITVLSERLALRERTDRFEIDIAAKAGLYKEKITMFYLECVLCESTE